jgi:hypothetical protein
MYSDSRLRNWLLVHARDSVEARRLRRAAAATLRLENSEFARDGGSHGPDMYTGDEKEIHKLAIMTLQQGAAPRRFLGVLVGSRPAACWTVPIGGSDGREHARARAQVAAAFQAKCRLLYPVATLRGRRKASEAQLGR